MTLKYVGVNVSVKGCCSLCQLSDRLVSCPWCTLPLSQSQLGLTPAPSPPSRISCTAITDGWIYLLMLYASH